MESTNNGYRKVIVIDANSFYFWKNEQNENKMNILGLKKILVLFNCLPLLTLALIIWIFKGIFNKD